jgi:hypothetical protein
MPDREKRIAKAINKYGADVTLNFKPTTVPPVNEDWPDPSTLPPPPAPAVVKAIMVPMMDVEGRDIVAEGQPVTERVEGFFLAAQDLNEVDTVVWQGGEYYIQSQDAYELQGQILAQQTLLVRREAARLFPHT